jgi:hypothetical protein
MLCESAIPTIAKLGDESAVEPLVQVLNSDLAPVEIVADALALLYDRFEKKHGEGRYIAELSCRFIRPRGIQRIIDALGKAPAELRSLILILGWVSTVTRLWTWWLSNWSPKISKSEALRSPPWVESGISVPVPL